MVYSVHISGVHLFFRISALKTQTKIGNVQNKSPRPQCGMNTIATKWSCPASVRPIHHETIINPDSICSVPVFLHLSLADIRTVSQFAVWFKNNFHSIYDSWNSAIMKVRLRNIWARVDQIDDNNTLAQQIQLVPTIPTTVGLVELENVSGSVQSCVHDVMADT